jgi:hypothetical protein
VVTAHSASARRCLQSSQPFIGVTALATFMSSCSANVDAEHVWGQQGAALLHGADDRKEYFEIADGAGERLAQSAVALIPKSRLAAQGAIVAIEAPTLGEADALCPGEPFADQPAAAFCSAVLVDWDLILTAGHCARVLALGEFAAVFGYFYAAPSHLELTPQDVVDVTGIVAEALDPMAVEPRLDYAWMRLARAVEPPRRPLPISLANPLERDLPILSMGSPGGIPLKLDAGGKVRDAREAWLDYFTADTDTSHGSSGGGAVDAQLSLLGILARGGSDFIDTPSGCRSTRRIPEATLTEEQFTYAERALNDLCESGSQASLCRSDCGDPCEALPPSRAMAAIASGCTFQAGQHPAQSSLLWAALAATGIGAALARRLAR